jgi:plastocyanin
MMTIRNMQMRKHLWPLCAMMGVLLASSFTLAVRAQMVHAAPDDSKGYVQWAAAAAVQAGAKVSIANFAFTPAEITIAPGESVTWTNDDGAPHGLEYQDGAAGTDLLLPGASFSRRFDRSGTYDYNCSIHPYMTGRVIVRAQ